MTNHLLILDLDETLVHATTERLARGRILNLHHTSSTSAYFPMNTRISDFANGAIVVSLTIATVAYFPHA